MFEEGKYIDCYLHTVTYKGESKLLRLYLACTPNIFIERFLNTLHVVFSAAPLSKIFWSHSLIVSGKDAALKARRINFSKILEIPVKNQNTS